ncbi:MAG: DHHW family protein [Acutalibacteraceae bacterium]
MKKSGKKGKKVFLDDEYYIGMQVEPLRKKGKISRRTANRIKIVTGIALFLVVVILCIIGIVWLIVNGFEKDDKNENKATSASVSESATEPDYLTFIEPKIKDTGKKGVMSNYLYLYNKAAYETFKGTDIMAKTYVDTITDVAKTLPKGTKVYDMIIPTHCEMNLPQSCKDDAEITSQKDYISYAYREFYKGGSVTPINCYNVLASHNDEYIYFNLDHHWTALGAYYAYTAFANQTNQDVMTISQEKSNTIEGFRGSFAPSLSSNWRYITDTVTYYDLPYETSLKIYNSKIYQSGESDNLPVYYPDAVAGSNTYGVFLWGDQPLEVIKSECGTNKKIAVVKESFGNAFVPYLANNYSEIHVLDIRDCSVKLSDYIKENKIDEVLFINNVMSTASSDRIINIEGLE